MAAKPGGEYSLKFNWLVNRSAEQVDDKADSQYSLDSTGVVRADSLIKLSSKGRPFPDFSKPTRCALPVLCAKVRDTLDAGKDLALRSR